mgnify:CR=1 FL=1
MRRFGCGKWACAIAVLIPVAVCLPVQAAVLAELGGADAITIHLREDRRHIQDRDVRVLRETVRLRLNLEMAVSDEITRIALQTMPDQVTLVPERREEVTTEGGLDVITHVQRVQQCADQLSGAGILVSLFIDPDVEQVRKACELKVAAVELHTGAYAEARTRQQREAEFIKQHPEVLTKGKKKR